MCHTACGSAQYALWRQRADMDGSNSSRVHQCQTNCTNLGMPPEVTARFCLQAYRSHNGTGTAGSTGHGASASRLAGNCGSSQHASTSGGTSCVVVPPSRLELAHACFHSRRQQGDAGCQALGHATSVRLEPLSAEDLAGSSKQLFQQELVAGRRLRTV